MSEKLTNLSHAAATALLLAFASASAHAADIIGLITKTNTNPFFVKMKQGFDAKAKELGLTPQAYAGKYDGDNEGQVAAMLRGGLTAEEAGRSPAATICASSAPRSADRRPRLFPQ